MIGWIRVVIPVSRLVGSLILYLALELPLLYAEARWGFTLNLFQRPAVLVMMLLTGVYGLHRVSHFHPILSQDYREWLMRTPWSRPLPLPLGPVEIVWQDVLVVLILSALPYWLVGLSPLILLETFLTAYLVMLASALGSTGPWPFGYILGFGLGLAALYVRDHPTCVVILIGVYLIGYIGLRRSLSLFPWQKAQPEFPNTDQLLVNAKKPESAQNPITWPYQRLGPSVSHVPSIRTRDAVLFPLLLGWLLFALAWLPGNAARAGETATTFGFLMIMGFPAIRLALYRSGYAPPISLWGRLARGTWIIPGYDKILFAPLGGLAVGLTAIIALTFSGLTPDVVIPIGVSLTGLFVLNLGPTLKSWCLTGHHRIVPGVKNVNEFIEVG
jgi:hypothetical protein